MTVIAIEKGIPMPEVMGRTGRPKAEETKAMEAMEPGDSFFLPEQYLVGRVNSARKRLKDRKFCIRKMDHGWRVWRVA